jgi:hypothetical protein
LPVGVTSRFLRFFLKQQGEEKQWIWRQPRERRSILGGPTVCRIEIRLLHCLGEALPEETLLQLLEFLRLHYPQGHGGGHLASRFPFGS